MTPAFGCSLAFKTFALLFLLASETDQQLYRGQSPHPQFGGGPGPGPPYNLGHLPNGNPLYQTAGQTPLYQNAGPNPYQGLFGQRPPSQNHFGVIPQLFRQSFNGDRFPLGRALPMAPACRPVVPPKIDFGDCPMLEPKEEDKMKKMEKQKECLKDLEVSENSTLEALSQPLQDKIHECVLRKEELLNEAGKYNYEKALEKLKAKGLPEQIEKKISEAHVECKIQAEGKHLSLNQILPEVSLYQQCMDFHLAMLCNIKIVNPSPPLSPHFHGIHQLPGQSPNNYPNLPNVPNFGNVMNRLNILSQVLR